MRGDVMICMGCEEDRPGSCLFGRAHRSTSIVSLRQVRSAERPQIFVVVLPTRLASQGLMALIARPPVSLGSMLVRFAQVQTCHVADKHPYPHLTLPPPCAGLLSCPPASPRPCRRSGMLGSRSWAASPTETDVGATARHCARHGAGAKVLRLMHCAAKHCYPKWRAWPKGRSRVCLPGFLDMACWPAVGQSLGGCCTGIAPCCVSRNYPPWTFSLTRHFRSCD